MQPDVAERLVLGTAQLCKEYGVTNRFGPPARREIFDLLSFAWDSGIKRYDTAPVYGSESVLGEFLGAHGVSDVARISTKLPGISNNHEFEKEITFAVKESLRQLGGAIDVYFFHRPEDSSLLLKCPEFFQELTRKYPIETIGVSVYSLSETEDLRSLWGQVAFQYPLSFADRRFEDLELTPGRNYARSVFLQGLLVSVSCLNERIPQQLSKFHKRYHEVLRYHRVDPVSFALTYILNCNMVNYFVIGVERLEQVRKIIATPLLEYSEFQRVAADLPMLPVDCHDPRNWGTGGSKL